MIHIYTGSYVVSSLSEAYDMLTSILQIKFPYSYIDMIIILVLLGSCNYFFFGLGIEEKGYLTFGKASTGKAFSIQASCIIPRFPINYNNFFIKQTFFRLVLVST